MAKMTTIVAIDPGAKHTAVAALYQLPTVEIQCLTVDTELFSVVLWEVLCRLSPDVVVLEKFALYPWMAKAQAWSTFRTVEVIGVVRLWCETEPAQLVLQTAAERKSVKTRDLKEKYGIECADNHQRDAAKHLVVYLRKEQRRAETRGT